MLAGVLLLPAWAEAHVAHRVAHASFHRAVAHASGRAAIAMDSSWRPKTVDPLSQVWGVPAAKERSYEYWLDLRTSEVTFAQQALVKLFYAVRRVVDEAGKSLPKGAKVQGLLFDAARYDRADTIGAEVPIYLDSGGGTIMNATKLEMVPLPTELRAPSSSELLRLAQEELLGLREEAKTTAIALEADAQLWAQALTGLTPDKLVCIDEGA